MTKTFLLIVCIICFILSGCGAGLHYNTYKAVIVSKTFTTTTIKNIKTGKLVKINEVYPENVQDTIIMQEWQFE